MKKLKKPKQDNAVITVEEALDLLAPHKEGRKLRVHTFQSAVFALMGYDMDLTQLKRELKESFKADDTNIRLSGDQMRGIGHGVAFKYNGTWTFLATDKYKVNQKLISKGYIEAVIPAKTHIKGERRVFSYR